MESNRRLAENETDAIKSASALSTTFVDSGSATYHSEPQPTTPSTSRSNCRPALILGRKLLVWLVDSGGNGRRCDLFFLLKAAISTLVEYLVD